VQVWSVRQEDNVLTYRGHDSEVETLAWSPDSKYIVSGSTDGVMQLWDASSGRTVSTSGSMKNAPTVVWSPPGNRIAAPGIDGTILIWTTSKRDGTNSVVNLNGNELNLGFQFHASRVTGLAWSPDGAFIAATSADGNLRIWKPTNNELDSSAVTLSTHAGSLSAVTWEPDGKHIAVAGSDMSVQVWDVTSKQRVFTYHYTAKVNAITWSPDGKYIAIAGADGTASVLDPTSRVGRLVTTYRAHFGSVNAVAWSPNSSLVASASDDTTVQLWDPKTGNHIFTYSASGSSP
jgi:eukaryotic-like serine/threonine-protein kinase